MHCHPWVLVTAETSEEAVENANTVIQDAIEDETSFDYGGVDGDVDGEISPVAAGTTEYEYVVTTCIAQEELEKESLWEQLRNGMTVYMGRDKCPDSDEVSKIQYRIGFELIGVASIGNAITSDRPFWMTLWVAGKLRSLLSHIHDRTGDWTPDSCLFDARDMSAGPVDPLLASAGVWAVRADLHY